jgi:hypothetical protein
MAVKRTMSVEYSGTGGILTPSGNVWIDGRKFSGFSKVGVPASIVLDYVPSNSTRTLYIAMEFLEQAPNSGIQENYPGFQSSNFQAAVAVSQDSLSTVATSGSIFVIAISNIDGSHKVETLTYVQQ